MSLLRPHVCVRGCCSPSLCFSILASLHPGVPPPVSPSPVLHLGIRLLSVPCTSLTIRAPFQHPTRDSATIQNPSVLSRRGFMPYIYKLLTVFCGYPIVICCLCIFLWVCVQPYSFTYPLPLIIICYSLFSCLGRSEQVRHTVSCYTH